MLYLVGGRAGEGKTTFANMCSNAFYYQGVPTAIGAFAKGVKETAKFMGWDGNKDDAGRRLLQNIGRAGREYNPDIWAERTLAIVLPWEVANKGSCAYFIDDWRFPNEDVVARRIFGIENVKTIRIVRPEKFHALLGLPTYNDSSETSLPLSYNYDYVINNIEDSLVILEKLATNFVACQFNK
jgi:hypothetical protein